MRLRLEWMSTCRGRFQSRRLISPASAISIILRQGCMLRSVTVCRRLVLGCMSSTVLHMSFTMTITQL